MNKLSRDILNCYYECIQKKFRDSFSFSVIAVFMMIVTPFLIGLLLKVNFFDPNASITPKKTIMWAVVSCSVAIIILFYSLVKTDRGPLNKDTTTIKDDHLKKLYYIIRGVTYTVTPSQIEILKSQYQSVIEKTEKKYTQMKTTASIFAGVPVLLTLFKNLFPAAFEGFFIWSSENDLKPLEGGLLLVLILCLVGVLFNIMISYIQGVHKATISTNYKKCSIMVESLDLLLLRMNLETGELNPLIPAKEWENVDKDYERWFNIFLFHNYIEK